MQRHMQYILNLLLDLDTPPRFTRKRIGDYCDKLAIKGEDFKPIFLHPRINRNAQGLMPDNNLWILFELYPDLVPIALETAPQSESSLQLALNHFKTQQRDANREILTRTIEVLKLHAIHDNAATRVFLDSIRMLSQSVDWKVLFDKPLDEKADFTEQEQVRRLVIQFISHYQLNLYLRKNHPQDILIDSRFLLKAQNAWFTAYGELIKEMRQEHRQIVPSLYDPVIEPGQPAYTDTVIGEGRTRFSF